MLEVDTQLFMGNMRHHNQAADAMFKVYYKWNAGPAPLTMPRGTQHRGVQHLPLVKPTLDFLLCLGVEILAHFSSFD
jgi:hypothetical protein